MQSAHSRDEDYRVNPRYREVELTEQGKGRLESACQKFPGLWCGPERRRDEVERLHASGRPLLVGTRSVRASQRLADLLTARGLSFQLLNATRLAEEAVIVACAGEHGRITIATNMAGRGTDIRLGQGVAALGGLHVLTTERHESGRVDRQLMGRSARQGDPGSAQAFVSLEDELIARHLPKSTQLWLRAFVEREWAVRNSATAWAFNRAQARAQAFAFRQRQAVLRADSWLDESLAFAGLEPTI